MREKSQLKLLVIDPLANNEHGHLFDDDLFWSMNLPPLVSEFGIRSSKESIKNILNAWNRNQMHHPIDAKPLPFLSWKRLSERLRLILMCLFFKKGKYTDVLFQSFETVSTIIFILLRPNCKVHIIVTNNLSKEQFLHHALFHKLLIRLTFNLSKTIFVHSQFEMDLITAEYRIPVRKVVIKPFHQLAISWQNNSNKYNKGYILFVGPVRLNRPISPFLELIRADKGQINKYLISGVRQSDFINHDDILERSNVEINFGFSQKTAYIEIITNSKLIVLTHNHYFEGRLSGIFCDAVASRTPVISSAIEPVTEYFRKYGRLGLIADFSNNEWIASVLNDNFSISEFNKVVDKIKEDTKSEKIIEIVLNAICKVT